MNMAMNNIEYLNTTQVSNNLLEFRYHKLLEHSNDYGQSFTNCLKADLTTFRNHIIITNYIFMKSH